jgi:hypothetical protein
MQERNIYVKTLLNGNKKLVVGADTYEWNEAYQVYNRRSDNEQLKWETILKILKTKTKDPIEVLDTDLIIHIEEMIVDQPYFFTWNEKKLYAIRNRQGKIQIFQEP